MRGKGQSAMAICLDPVFRDIGLDAISQDLRSMLGGFLAASIMVFFMRFSPAQYKLISCPSGSFK